MRNMVGVRSESGYRETYGNMGSGMNMVRKKGQPRLVTLMKQIGEAAELKGMQESSTLCPVAGARISGTWTGQL